MSYQTQTAKIHYTRTNAITTNVISTDNIICTNIMSGGIDTYSGTHNWKHHASYELLADTNV